ncbi:MAG TPA: hypothetical protein VFU07_08090 [Candidatus Lumbricidophila sp.]|nr:hypothetical protein [Candidatus Lumbricidophila sp.]
MLSRLGVVPIIGLALAIALGGATSAESAPTKSGPLVVDAGGGRVSTLKGSIVASGLKDAARSGEAIITVNLPNHENAVITALDNEGFNCLVAGACPIRSMNISKTY